MKDASSWLEKLPVCGACYAVAFGGTHVFIEVEGVLANHTASFLLARSTKVLKPRNLGVGRRGDKV